MRRLAAAVVPAGIVVASLVVFLPALEGEFNWDDDVNLSTNPFYRGFQPSRVRWMFTNALMGHYMPFTWLTFAGDHALGGMNPVGYHLTSLLLHAINAVIVYVVARRLLDIARPAAIDTQVGATVAALLFALHPQRVESVAWISDRATLLCATFYLGAVLAYLRGAPAGVGGRRSFWHAISLAAFAAALLSKGIAMSLPVTLLILDAYPLRRWRRGARIRVLVEKLPYFALAIGGAVVAALARSQGSEFSGYESYGIAARVGMIAYSLCFYPLTLVWPADLSPLYEAPSRVGLLDPRFLAPVVVVLVVTGLLIVLRRRVPGLTAAWAHSAAVVLPVSGVAHSGLQMVADRYSYLAHLGFVILAGYGVLRLVELYREGRVRRGVAVVAAGGIVLGICALGGLSWSQSYVWRSPETLWQWAVDVDPLCSRCHGNLGVALMRRRPDPPGLAAAQAHLERAVALRPDYALAHLNLGTVQLLRGRYREAEVTLRGFVESHPDAVEGTERLAVLYLVEGRTPEAVPLLRRARRVAPIEGAPADLAAAVRLLHDGETLRYLGQALLEQGRADDAIIPLSRAVQLEPSTPAFRVLLARAYRDAGRVTLAEAELATLRRLAPAAAGPAAR
jgi:Flp pilus assembly protein TadD